MITSLEFRTAEKLTGDFRDDVMADHKEAMSCMHCESAIEFGLKASNYLLKAQEAFEDAIDNEVIAFNSEDYVLVQAGLMEIFKDWIELGTKLIDKIRRFETVSYEVDGSKEFVDRFETIVDWLETQEWLMKAKATRRALCGE